jgi:pimeloyl-ACP methyl ester carboxylesterase
MNTSFWKTDLFGMWHLIFLNIPFLPRLVFRWLPDQLFNVGVEKSFVDLRNLEGHAASSYRKMFRDPEYSRYWIRLYRGMARSLILRRFPFLRPVLSGQAARFPERSPRAYQTNFLLLWGEEDRFAPVWVGEDIRDNLMKRGAPVTFKQLPRAGHFVQEEQPGLCVEHLLEHWR